MTITNRDYRKDLIRKYIEDENPPPLRAWLREHHLIKQTFDKVSGELIAEKNNKDIKQRKMDAINGLLPYDSEEILGGGTDRVDKALLRACEQGNAAALKIYYQLTNRLVEKSEQNLKLELSADDIAARNLIADRELDEFRGEDGHRVEEVQKESTLLSQ